MEDMVYVEIRIISIIIPTRSSISRKSRRGSLAKLSRNSIMGDSIGSMGRMSSSISRKLRRSSLSIINIIHNIGSISIVNRTSSIFSLSRINIMDSRITRLILIMDRRIAS